MTDQKREKEIDPKHSGDVYDPTARVALPTASLADANFSSPSFKADGSEDFRADLEEMKRKDTLPPKTTIVGAKQPSSGSDFERSVTVFGFPREKFSHVMRYFRQIGNIEAFELGEGNWVNIRYETEQQAKLALNKDRERMDGVIMLGVVKCDRQFRLRQSRRRLSSLGVSRHRTVSELSRPYALEQVSKQFNTNQQFLKLSVPRGQGAVDASLRRRDGLCQRLMRWFFNL